jgi:kumamolisin
VSSIFSKVHVSNPQSRNPPGSRAAVLATILLAAVSAVPAPAFSGARHSFSESIVEIASDRSALVMRRTLTASEHSETLPFSVSLKMPNFAELENRIAHGERIAPDVMAARYLPSAADYTATETWLKGQGFQITMEDPNHTNIFASGTVSRIEHAMGVNFARVATIDGEFTSAVSAPNLPEELSGAVLAIDGLQPHLRMHPHIQFEPNVITISGTQFLAPADILAAYNSPGTLNGAGQTIAIIMGATVHTSDLSTFYSTVGSTATTANFTTKLINNGPTPTSQNADAVEAALDTEWSSAIAPGAQVWLYAIPSLTNTSIIAACNQILADAATNNITVAAVSVGGVESGFSNSTMQADSQIFLQMANAGITVLFASGDGGSNPGASTGTYSASNPLQAEYPASDPNVAGVGGTSLILTSNTFSYAGETAFSTISSGGNFATGGGISQFFARPSWQTDGGSVLGNANRCVPDISIVWSSVFQGTNSGPSALVVSNGGDFSVGGTSLSVQVWGGIVAILNQARSVAGKGSIGLLGPLVYPLHGTSAFNDITSGNNGAYSAGPAYDLCTGLGSPNITNLASALGTVPASPAPAPATSASSAPASGGGGGGALSYGFYLALAILFTIRLATKGHKWMHTDKH